MPHYVPDPECPGQHIDIIQLLRRDPSKPLPVHIDGLLRSQRPAIVPGFFMGTTRRQHSPRKPTQCLHGRREDAEKPKGLDRKAPKPLILLVGRA